MARGRPRKVTTDTFKKVTFEFKDGATVDFCHEIWTGSDGVKKTGWTVIACDNNPKMPSISWGCLQGLIPTESTAFKCYTVMLKAIAISA